MIGDFSAHLWSAATCQAFMQTVSTTFPKHKGLTGRRAARECSASRRLAGRTVDDKPHLGTTLSVTQGNTTGHGIGATSAHRPTITRQGSAPGQAQGHHKELSRDRLDLKHPSQPPPPLPVHFKPSQKVGLKTVVPAMREVITPTPGKVRWVYGQVPASWNYERLGPREEGHGRRPMMMAPRPPVPRKAKHQAGAWVWCSGFGVDEPGRCPFSSRRHHVGKGQGQAPACLDHGRLGPGMGGRHTR